MTQQGDSGADSSALSVDELVLRRGLLLFGSRLTNVDVVAHGAGVGADSVGWWSW